MKTFLEEVAVKIIDSHPNLSGIKIILPTKRSIGFLKEVIKRHIKQPVFSPEIVGMGVFIQELSGLETESKINVIHDLYTTYKKVSDPTSPIDVDEFMSWAFQLLQDFNEIDAYLTDPEKIFNEISALEAMSSWGQDDTKHTKNHFYKHLFTYYTELRNTLLSKGKAYAGMQYREAVNNLSLYLETHEVHHYFIGLNAFNAAEKQIVETLLYEKKATVWWDLDPYFYEESQHPASHFIRQYASKWKPHLQPPQFEKNFEKPKTIHLISTSKDVAQAAYAVQIAKKYAEQNSATAVVLGQESMLIPALSSINSATDAWNVTMGYPLASTEVSLFFNLLFEVHENRTPQGFSFFKVAALLQCCRFYKVLEEQEIPVRKFLKQWATNNTSYLNEELFEMGGTTASSEWADLLFQPFEKAATFLARLTKISDLAHGFYSRFKDLDSKLWVRSFLKLQSVFEKLQPLCENDAMPLQLEQLHFFVRELLSRERIDFKGTPFSEIQIMGLLETRALDFENVIITNLNEGILPNGKSFGSFIPFEVRKNNELPTFLDADKLFAYPFFRLLQRAKNIYLLYNETTEGLSSGAKSRFIHLLEHFNLNQHTIVHEQLESVYEQVTKNPKTATKTDEVVARLKEVATEGISPSSLVQYIRNPYDFYEQRLLGIKERPSLEKSLRATDKGTLIHQVLETLYTPYLNIRMEAHFYNEMISKLDDTMHELYAKVAGGSSPFGNDYMTVEISKEIIRSFLRQEQEVAASNNLTVIALETSLETEVVLPQQKITVRLRGTADRIDVLNGTHRLIDYKTGSVEPNSLWIKDWELLRQEPKRGPCFQVLLYAMMFHTNFKEAAHLQAGIISFRNFDTSFMPIMIPTDQKKKMPLNIDAESCEKFQGELITLLEEIFGPTPFVSEESG